MRKPCAPFCDRASAHCSQAPFHELWHYLNPGSGIFFNLGKTHVVLDHNDFQVTPTNTGCQHWGGNNWDGFFGCLRGKGFDSVQISHHMEHSTTVMEIVNLRDQHGQWDGCFGADQAHRYSRGWDGSLPCICRGGHGWGHAMNCYG